MRVNSFSLQIPEGREVDSGHVQLPHGTVYRIKLGNHAHRRCDAVVSVDGKEVGTFRLNSHDSVVLERGAEDTGKFTFFTADSTEGVAAGSSTVSVDNRGLVQVVFKPELATTHVCRGSMPCNGTGESGRCCQN